MAEVSADDLQSGLADNGSDIRHWREDNCGNEHTSNRVNDMTGLTGRWFNRRWQTRQTNDHYRSRHKNQSTRRINTSTPGRKPYQKTSVTFMVMVYQSARLKVQSMGNRKEGKLGMSDSISFHNNRSEVQHTLQIALWIIRNHTHSKMTGISLAYVDLIRFDGNGTPTYSRIQTDFRRINTRKGYKAVGSHSVLTTVSFLSADLTSVSESNSGWKKHREVSMEASGCRSDAANQDLLEAKQGYETRAAARNKRKVEELEAKVKRAEEGRTEEEIAAEVNWPRDPGTPSKRATQFVRTKAESWRTKMLIAKALETAEIEKQNIATEVILTEEQMGKIINYNNSLEGRINTVHEAVQIVNKKLTLLILILRDTVNAAPGTSQPAKTGEEDNETIEAMQARMNTHMRQMGLDTIIQMGKFI